jgi:hypothetical protein
MTLALTIIARSNDALVQRAESPSKGKDLLSPTFEAPPLQREAKLLRFQARQPIIAQASSPDVDSLGYYRLLSNDLVQNIRINLGN